MTHIELCQKLNELADECLVDGVEYEAIKAHDMEQRNQVAALQRRVERYQAALESIAKPALGGKLQQYTAQEALKAPREVRG